jgi:DNA-directed RNA polymerase subunit beta
MSTSTTQELTIQKVFSKVNRFSYSKIQEVMDLPNLIQIQLDSYDWFLQNDIDPSKRKDHGLESVFRATFPIESSNKDLVLNYVSYSLGDMKCTEQEARDKDMTYSIQLKATVQLIYTETGEVREKEIYLGDIPAMTPRGTFIINGAERVVVSQIHKSPGVVFSRENRKNLLIAKIIPDKGAWLEFELDTSKEYLYVKIDRKKRILITTLIRAIGYETNKEIIEEFYDIIDFDITAEQSDTTNIRLAEDIVNPDDSEEVIYHAGSELLPIDYDKIKEMGYQTVKIVDEESIKRCPVLIHCLDKDDIETKDEAIQYLHNMTRPGEQTTLENAEKEFNRLFFDPKRYDLGAVGRYKMNQKLYEDPLTEQLILIKEDFILTIQYLLDIYIGEKSEDDIDHLGNRRIRTVGELLVNQLKVGFSRMERAIKERMNTENIDEITPQRLISTKPVMAVIKEFFGSSQLSQFMDQNNPLAELTHKRRLNALGPGGLSRDRAGFEVRDVHHTHYGRMCPIETPEGPNIGLILSLTTFAKINEYGFLVTPYRKVTKGAATDKIQYLTAMEEERYNIAQANTVMDKTGKFTEQLIPCRHRGRYPLLPPRDVHFMDVSSKQIISVSTALIPFLEHDDANRALMGSNMQRQAVPLVNAESPFVGTGIEGRAAYDSGVCVICKRQGKVIKASSTEIHVEVDDEMDPVDIYSLIKFCRTNQNTCFNQKPVVKKGDEVEQGQLLADGPACDHGELALGRNILVAFMSWYGYNYEDAIIVSERLVREDTFTSIHIEELEVEARETKLGSEKITRDIPNLPDEAFRYLDENGIIQIGAQVEPGDILVGKVTPKGETDLTPEYKLLHSIFGEKAREVRDTSLRVPHGNGGIVIDRHIFRRDEGDDLAPGVEQMVKIFLAQKRKLSEGDKMAGRHGNKGVISRICADEDMPYLPDGTPVDIILNPLGVPSRMNIGQLLETMLGWGVYLEGKRVATPVFEGATLDEIRDSLDSVGLPKSGQCVLRDGLTGELIESNITVGMIYMLKLAHMVDDKLHARSTGPYSLVTQQPLGGKAQFGGQRLGEMEVWALEAYGAANTLQEFLTVKSDDMMGRARIYETIVKGEYTSAPGIPESFNVLVQELRGLALDLNIFDSQDNLLGLTDKDLDTIRKMKNKI